MGDFRNFFNFRICELNESVKPRQHTPAQSGSDTSAKYRGSPAPKMNRSNSLQAFQMMGESMMEPAASTSTGAAPAGASLVNSATSILPPSSVVAPIFGTSGQHVQKSAKEIDLNEVFAGEKRSPSPLGLGNSVCGPAPLRLFSALRRRCRRTAGADVLFSSNSHTPPFPNDCFFPARSFLRARRLLPDGGVRSVVGG